MTHKETTQGRIDHCKRLIEHCVSVIALCRISHSPKAEASYEAQLARLNSELAELEGYLATDCPPEGFNWPAGDLEMEDKE